MDAIVTIKMTLSEARLLRKTVEGRIAGITAQLKDGGVHGADRVELEKERGQLTRTLDTL